MRIKKMRKMYRNQLPTAGEYRDHGNQSDKHWALLAPLLQKPTHNHYAWIFPGLNIKNPKSMLTTFIRRA